jgi:hypothetical protein
MPDSTYTPYSYIKYAGTGSDILFAIPFPYINKSHVHVLIDDTESLAEDYLWLNDCTI